MAAGKRGPKSANERLRRLLAMLPWIMEQGEVAVAAVAERFGTTPETVIADLERASMCGVPPFGPGDLIDLFVDEGIVYAGMPRFFTKPLRLTAPEGFALLVAGRASLQLPGAVVDGPLARALDKLEAKLGAVGVEVELRRNETVDAVAAAVEQRAQLRIGYWSGRQDASSERVIDPLVVFTDRGYWYVMADDHRSGEERVFRIDRIETVALTGETFTGHTVTPPTESGWFATEDLPRATLRVAATAQWVIERYATDSVTTLPDGSLEVVMPITSEHWLARLLLRAGPDIAVVAPEQWQGLAHATAQRVLARYASPSSA